MGLPVRNQRWVGTRGQGLLVGGEKFIFIYDREMTSLSFTFKLTVLPT